MSLRGTSFRSFAAALILLAAGIGPAAAERQLPLCASVQAAVAKDAALAKATAAVFPGLRLSRKDSDCTYPFELLHFDDADVLLTTAGKPGEACHGCAARLSAFVLAPPGPAGHLVADFKGFAESGTFGDPGDVKAARFAGHDTITIESGAMFQGYASGGVTFFMFEGGALHELKPSLDLSASNEGAVGASPEAFGVDGAWRIDPPDTIRIVYKIKEKGRTSQSSASWRFKDGKLVLVAGKVPKALGRK